MKKKYIELRKEGDSLLESNKRKEAIDKYDEALHDNPKYSTAYSHKAMVLLAEDKHGEAIENYKNAIKCNPNYKEAYTSLAKSLLTQAKNDKTIDLPTAYDQAIKHCQKAYEIDKKYLYAYRIEGTIRILQVIEQTIETNSPENLGVSEQFKKGEKCFQDAINTAVKYNIKNGKYLSAEKALKLVDVLRDLHYKDDKELIESIAQKFYNSTINCKYSNLLNDTDILEEFKLDPDESTINVEKNDDVVVMKTSGDISKSDLISKIDKVVHNEKLSASFAEFSQKVRELNQKSSTPNFLKLKEEKQEFLNKVKTFEEFNLIKEDTNVMKELINNDFFEFLLPYVMITHDIGEYKNVELIGLGFYDANQEILSE